MTDWSTLVDRIAESGNLSKACRETGLSKTRFLAAVGEDRQLADRYARAREAGLDAEADRAIEEACNATDAGLARVALDARKWYLSKLLPKKYGERTTLAGDPDAPIKHTVSLTDAPEDVLRYLATQGGKVDGA